MGQVVALLTQFEVVTIFAVSENMGSALPTYQVDPLFVFSSVVCLPVFVFVVCLPVCACLLFVSLSVFVSLCLLLLLLLLLFCLLVFILRVYCLFLVCSSYKELHVYVPYVGLFTRPTKVFVFIYWKLRLHPKMRDMITLVQASALHFIKACGY